MGDSLHLTLEVSDDDLRPNDPHVLRGVEELRERLAREDGVAIVVTDDHGWKGWNVVGDTITALIAGGAGLTGILTVVTIWLRERGTRKVTVRIAGETIHLESKNVGEGTVAEVLRQLLARSDVR